MRRIVIVLAGFAVVSVADSRLSGQSAQATLSISATVSKNCTISTAPVAFGAYDSVGPNATAPRDGTGTVTVTCTKGAVAKVGLNAGSNAGAGTTRRMAGSAAEFLTYELYKDAAHATVWGNTASDSLEVPAAVNQNPQNFTVYGRVPQNQTAAVGSYTDTVLATVNF
jgi:spore coat protein U-like protein